MPTEEIVYVCRGSVENGNYVFVSSRPRVLQKLLCASFVVGQQIIPQPIKRLAQRPPPFLVPAGTASGIAPAVTFPARHAVRAAPRGLFFDADLLSWRMQREVLAIIGQASEIIFLNILQGKGEGHVAMRMM